MTTQHTAGPWYQLSGPEGSVNISKTTGPDWASAENYVGVVEAPYAALIAAAPQMAEENRRLREALVEIVWVRDVIAETGSNDPSIPYDVTRQGFDGWAADLANAALAAADGQED